MDLPEFELERYFARYEFEVPHLLGASDVEPYRLDELLALSGEEERGIWDKLSLGYTESAGNPSLRAEVSGLYETVDREGILVFSGAEEAIFVLLNVALGPGDHAVVTWPAYSLSLCVSFGYSSWMTLKGAEDGFVYSAVRWLERNRPSAPMEALTAHRDQRTHRDSLHKEPSAEPSTGKLTTQGWRSP